MKLNVFISWSGERSKAVALKLSKWLPKVIQAIKPWMSDEDIPKGSRWALEISKNLESHQIGIICITPENIKSEWLLYEAGALSKALGESHIFPLLIGISPNMLSGPFSLFQATSLEKNDFYKLIESLNSKLEADKVSDYILKEGFANYWKEIDLLITELSNMNVANQFNNIDSLLESFSKHDFPPPFIENTAYFIEGFESHAMYEAITTISHNRFYNLSRLNRKLLDKEHWDFLKSLPDKIKSGYDFRLLFLDPNSSNEIIMASHPDHDFRKQLIDSIEIAKSVLSKFNIDYTVHCKKYSIVRSVAMVISDDAILYTPIKNNENGQPVSLTKESFNIVNIKSNTGYELSNYFLNIWSNSKPI